MGCNSILERHCRVVAALTLTLGVNGFLERGEIKYSPNSMNSTEFQNISLGVILLPFHC